MQVKTYKGFEKMTTKGDGKQIAKSHLPRHGGQEGGICQNHLVRGQQHAALQPAPAQPWPDGRAIALRGTELILADNLLGQYLGRYLVVENVMCDAESRKVLSTTTKVR